MLRYAAPLALMLMAGGAGLAQTPADLSNGNLRLVLGNGREKRLYVRGVPVFTEAHLFVVKPRWLGSMVNTEDHTPKVTVSKEGDVQVADLAYEQEDAFARFRYELHPDDTLKVRVEFNTRNKPFDGEIAYYLNANLLEGASWASETPDGPKSGVISPVPGPVEMTSKAMMPAFTRITFQTRLGEMELATQGDNATSVYSLFDSRPGKQDWAQRHPIFWYGFAFGDLKVRPEPYVTETTFRFRLKPAVPPAPAVAAAPKVALLSVVKTPSVPDMPVIPHPKSMTVQGAPLRLGAASRIVTSNRPTPEESKAAAEIQSELQRFWGLSLPVVRRNDVSPKTKTGPNIVLVRLGDGAPDPDAKASTPNRREGYYVRVRGGEAKVVGFDPRGVYNGAQTLKQLLRVDEKSVYVKPAVIRDWPSLSMRGVHWFGGPEGHLFHKAMIDRILAPLKMNTMVYEVEWAHWDSQPKLHGPRGESKANIKSSVDYARKHFIEPIPLVQSLGHSDWMFSNGQNLHLAANPEKPYSYDPAKPEAYEIVFGVMQEAIDLFKPRYFHIGHDELSGDEGFPPKGSTKTSAQYFVEDTLKIHGWLKERGIRTMMWGDEMLHHPTEAPDAANAESLEDAAMKRAALPKDIVITDWHYFVSGSSYPNVDIFQKAGFEVVGSPWFDWPTIRTFAKALADNRSKGFLQTTWAGYEMTPELVKTNAITQFIAYLVGAEYAWNGGSLDLDDLGYDPDETFRYLWDRGPVDMTKRSGFTVDLSPFSDAAMWEWVPAADGAAPAKTAWVPAGRANLAGTVFQAGRPAVLSGGLDMEPRPKALALDLGGRKAAELHWLWGASLPSSRGTKVATLTVTYADGQTEAVPIVYGNQISAFTDTRGSESLATAVRGRDPLGRPASIRRWAWKNPRPAAGIARVEIVSEQAGTAPVLLGLSGVE